MDKFSELKASAMAATPGPWVVTEKNNVEAPNQKRFRPVAYIFGNRAEHKRAADAAFIAAANPAAVLELLGERDADKKRIAELEAKLANREAQPVLYASEETLAYAKEGEKSLVTWSEPMGDAVIPLFTAPPAPAVPGIDELRLTFERSERESDDGFNLHKYGIGYADEATQARWESWLSCRAAMLTQPVSSGYKLPDNVREALTLALQAMEFMGDTLNNIDAVCTEDVEYVTPAFNAVRELLAAAPEGGN